MWNEPTQAELSRMPDIDATLKRAWRHTVIYQHFFIGNIHWYAAEYGWSHLHNDGVFYGVEIMYPSHAGWRYSFLNELRQFRGIGGTEIQRDTGWKERAASAVDQICKAYVNYREGDRERPFKKYISS